MIKTKTITHIQYIKEKKNQTKWPEVRTSHTCPKI